MLSSLARQCPKSSTLPTLRRFSHSHSPSIHLPSPTRIEGTYGWKSLEGKAVLNRKVDIVGMGDLHRTFRIQFPGTKIVLMRNCDKNFVYYWLDEFTFPAAEDIWLDSHPCDPRVFERCPKATLYICTNMYRRYKDDWFDSRNPRIVPVDREQIEYEVAEIDKGLQD